MESGLKISGFAAEFAGCVWTEAVSGKKKLRIQVFVILFKIGRWRTAASFLA